MAPKFNTREGFMAMLADLEEVLVAAPPQASKVRRGPCPCYDLSVMLM
jgi:hypothetical protein